MNIKKSVKFQKKILPCLFLPPPSTTPPWQFFSKCPKILFSRFMYPGCMDLKKIQNSMYGYMDLKKKLNIMYSKALRYAVFGSIKNRGFWFHKKPCSGGWTGANFFCLFVLDKFVKHVKKILTFWNFLNIKVTPD